VLYRVHAFKSCVLTTACLLAFEDYTVKGDTKTDVEAVTIPRAAFEEAMSTSPAFRRFVCSAYSRRITDLFLTVEEIPFGRMDASLTAKLLETAGTEQRVSAAHGVLATELAWHAA
jgi:CRP/FNR family transcriptional regulator